MQDELEIESAIEELLDGDTEQLAVLFDCFRSRLKQVVRLRVGGQLAARIDPSDVIQDVFVEATRRVPRYIQSPNVGFFVWLHSVTRDVLSNSIRRHTAAQNRSVYREVTLPTDKSAILGRELVCNNTPSRAVQLDELHEAVRDAVSKLKSDDREVILMRHFEGLSNNEMAQAIGINASTATMRHGRALARLKILLDDSFTASSGGNR